MRTFYTNVSVIQFCQINLRDTKSCEFPEETSWAKELTSYKAFEDLEKHIGLECHAKRRKNTVQCLQGSVVHWVKWNWAEPLPNKESGVQVIILFCVHIKKTARDRGGEESRFTYYASHGEEVFKKSIYHAAAFEQIGRRK